MGAQNIRNRLDLAKSQGRLGLIPFITAGYPSLASTEKILLTLDELGADVIEIGVPFSDPLADGPVIQKSSYAALQQKTNLGQILNMVHRVRSRIEAPLVLMAYYNSIYNYGLLGFMQAATAVGVDGLIIPDLPLEEADELREIADQKGLALVPLTAPTSNKQRIEAITKVARGFVYCVALTGVTGSENAISPQIANLTQTIRQYTDLPIAIGFGISKPEHIKKVAPYADAVIVGSGLIRQISKYADQKPEKHIASYLKELSAAL